MGLWSENFKSKAVNALCGFCFTLKNIIFLFFLKYKAESTLTGTLTSCLGKPWSSLKPVYLQNLSAVEAQREECCVKTAAKIIHELNKIFTPPPTEYSVHGSSVAVAWTLEKYDMNPPFRK